MGTGNASGGGGGAGAGLGGSGGGGLTTSALETVQESSLPSTPAINLSRRLGHQPQHEETQEIPSQDERNTSRPPSIKTRAPETKTDPADSKSSAEAQRKTSSAGHATGQPTAVKQPSTANSSTMTYSTLHPKSKGAPEGSVQSMTVETETVSSIPQVGLVPAGGGDRSSGPSRADTSGSIRYRPSLETVRPKKEKRRSVRKTPSLLSGTGKLRIFSARTVLHNKNHLT
jgi:hypothetical protein